MKPTSQTLAASPPPKPTETVGTRSTASQKSTRTFQIMQRVSFSPSIAQLSVRDCAITVRSHSLARDGKYESRKISARERCCGFLLCHRSDFVRGRGKLAQGY